jgi:hypothetical protein
MRKSWLFLTLVLLHLTPATAFAFCPPGEPLCSCVRTSDVPRLGPAPPVAVAVRPPPRHDASQQASQLYGAALLGLSTIVGAGFWMRARRARLGG